MRLRLINNDYRYAAEQILLMLFPEEKPEFEVLREAADGQSCDESTQQFAECKILRGKNYTTAVTNIRYNGIEARGVAKAANCGGGEQDTARTEQRLIKTSFYRAAVKITGVKPHWGTLTGIRPAKLALQMLEDGLSKKAAAGRLRRDYYVSKERASICVQAARSAAEVKKTISARDAALYIGIPFCPTRCAYCSFVSGSIEKQFSLVEPFLNTLHNEINLLSGTIQKLGLRLITVYIGGGTPTSLTSAQLDSLMAAVGKMFDLSSVREYTVEAGRPDTITAEKLDAITRHGATRVSVNPQSMNPRVLKAIGRAHTTEDIEKAVRLVRGTGLALNMDLIAGLPGDDTDSFCRSLSTVLEYKPENVTIHTLSLKKGSRIMLEGTEIPSGGEVGVMLDYASSRLTGEGYAPYYLYRQKFTSGGFENVGWGKKGLESLYNIVMMEELASVIAIGGGAVTKLVSPEGRIERVFNVKYPREYIERREKFTAKVSELEKFYSI